MIVDWGLDAGLLTIYSLYPASFILYPASCILHAVPNIVE